MSGKVLPAVSDEQFRLLVEAVKDYAIFLLDPEGNIATWNPGAERLKGYRAEEIIGRHFSNFYSEKDCRDRKPEAELAVATVKGRCEDEGWRVKKDGSRFWANVVITAIRGPAGELTGFAKITRDLTDRKRAEDGLRHNRDELDRRVQERTAELLALNERLRSSEARCRTLIDAMSAVVWTWDVARNSHHCTPPWHEYTGLPSGEARGWGWVRAVHEDDRMRAAADFREALAAGKSYTSEYRVRRADGQTRWMSVRGVPLKDATGAVREWTGVCMDVTEQRSLEDQLRQSQKMEAVGQLAGGVAHDFNNLLTIMSGYSELVLGMLASDHPMRSYLTAISEAGERAAGLTRQLLAFSRLSVRDVRVVDINDAVRDTDRLLRRVLGEDVLLTTILDPRISGVRADAGQIGQVLLNLAVNARDAMPTGGKLTIETRNVELDEAYVNTHVEVQKGRHVLIAVSDTGVGMPPEVKARIFEPFFTTKGVGKGTGLGLSVVYGFVKQSDGQIGAYSEVGIGTTFKIYLPAVEKAASHAGIALAPEGGERASETVLLVEDEAGVRGLALHTLQSRGYKVVPAASGEEALRAISGHTGGIDVLLTDVVMPGMSGRELVEELRPRFPRLKVLYMSGYTDDAVVRHGILQAEVAFLQKPYTPSVLLRRVRQVLDGQG